MQSFLSGAGHVKESAKLANCGDYLLFRHYYTVDKVRLHGAQFCKKHLLCPLCAIRRGSRMLTAYLERYEVVRRERPHLVPYLVTLTVVNGPDLRERLRHLRNGLKRMTTARRSWLAGKGPAVEFGKSSAGFHSIEVTNRGKGWHPHAHMIWMCGSPPSASRLSAEWKQWTGDSFVVDVRPLHDPVEGFLEVCKYAVKFSDLELADNWHAYEVMRGARLIDCHGEFRGVEIPESLTDEPLDGLPFFEYLYRYLAGAGYSLAPSYAAA